MVIPVAYSLLLKKLSFVEEMPEAGISLSFDEPPWPPQPPQPPEPEPCLLPTPKSKSYGADIVNRLTVLFSEKSTYI